MPNICTQTTSRNLLLQPYIILCAAELVTWGVGPDVYTPSKGKIVLRNVMYTPQVRKGKMCPHNVYTQSKRKIVPRNVMYTPQVREKLFHAMYTPRVRGKCVHAM